ncbi:response regulator [Lachnospiraceae bacterium 54-53]
MYTYIVVDDELLTRKGIIKKLEPLSEEISCVGEAENGKDGLELTHEKNPDIVITDMNMPVMDGISFLPALTGQFPDKQILVISGYKDFEYMKQAITAQAVDYILKPFSKETIQNSIRNAICQLENQSAIQNRLQTSEEEKEHASYDYDIQMLKNLILGYHNENISISSKRLSFINKTHNLVLMSMHSEHGIDQASLQNFLLENSFGDLALFLPHMHNKHLGFLILFIPERAALSPMDLCRQVADSLNGVFSESGQKILFGISRTHHSLMELHGAFMETVSALNSRVVSDGKNYCFIEPDCKEPVPFVWDRSEEFLFRIEAGMPVQTECLLKDLFGKFLSSQAYTLYDVKLFCFQLSDRVRYMMSTYFDHIDPHSVSSIMQNVLNSLFTLNELEDYYLQFYLNIAKILKSNSVYSMDDTIENMKIYIKRHYQNNLTIEFLSSLFYLNRSYCSHLFRERTGTTFVSYLNEIRLDNAKHLLLTTDKKMYQIAKNSGYDNTKYFFRIFKKYEHMTPEQFRKRYQSP